MKIGTDGSLAECRREGYTVIEYKKRELFTKGKLNREHAVRVTASNPRAWTDKGVPYPGERTKDLYHLDTYICWNAVIELYRTHKAAIDKLVGREAFSTATEEPTEYDLLTLIDEVNAYCGID